MPVPVGTRLGPYEVLGPIGSGGMGEVYKARDARLNRTVAVKVLPQHLAENSAMRKRLEREAKAVSSLNHPHICVLHDIGQQDGTDFLVMEYLEGETLATRLSRGPIPLEQGIALAIQMADALEVAHRKGVVHRDLKPANIMLTKTGCKLLDFGLARMDTSIAMDGETRTAAITNPGTVLGTFQYMAPEQLEGKEADARTDIFAFGAVLYEMVTGRKAFSAKSQASLISAIMSAEPPPIATEQPLTPPALERIVKTCLIKDPDGRWQSAHDVKLELTWLEQAVEPAAAVVKSRTRERIAFGLALVLLAVTLLLAYGYFHRGSPPARVVRSSLLPPPNHFFQRGNFAVSPDGTRLAFVAVGPDGSYKLWVRTFSASNAQPLNGTEGAILPFWAPDSRRIGFFASGKLNTIDIESGALRILGEAPTSRSGGTWSPNGTIVFSPALIGSLHRIPDTGGTSTPVTRVVRQASGQKHLWPSFLPDGKHFLFFAGWGSTDDSEENGIYVGSLDGSAPKLISSELTGNVIYSAGHLLYGRDRSLRAQLFDTDKLNLSGQAISISEQELEVDAVFFHSEYSISQNGVLVFQSLADSVSRLVWFDQTGKELGQIAELGYSDPRLSPDGRSLAVSSDDARNGKLSIRVYDLARAVSNRLTDAEDDESPAWSHDGGELAYATLDPKAHFLKTVGVDGSGPARALVKASGVMRHLDWAVDGHLVFTDLSSGFALLKIYSAGASKAVPFGNGAEARFSPDGKWIAYVGIPTGGIFVQPFPGPGGRIGISGATGAQPVWARDGKQVFYIAPDRKLMAVSFDAQHKTAGAPRVLFQTRIVAASFFGTQYDVAPDGRFLINSVPANYSSPLTLLTGWTAQLKQ